METLKTYLLETITGIKKGEQPTSFNFNIFVGLATDNDNQKILKSKSYEVLSNLTQGFLDLISEKEYLKNKIENDYLIISKFIGTNVFYNNDKTDYNTIKTIKSDIVKNVEKLIIISEII